MMCSAISFGFSLSSPAMRRSSSSSRPRRRVPAIGRVITLRSEQLHHRLRRRADDRDVGMAEEVHVRARVHLAQHPVDVERVGVELEVVALRQHDLEDVAGDGCAPWPPRPPAGTSRRASSERTSGSGSSPVGRGDRRVRRAAGRDRRPRRLDPRTAPRRRRRRGAAVVEAEHGDALDQVHPLTPVVERGERADHAHHRVGQAAGRRGARRAGARPRGSTS